MNYRIMDYDKYHKMYLRRNPCDFCKDNTSPKESYVHMSINIPFHTHYFCNETCANIYILQNSCKRDWE
jgi:hypothetical protein